MSRFKKLSKVRCQQPLVCWHGSVAFPILPIHIANLSRLSKCTLPMISIPKPLKLFKLANIVSYLTNVHPWCLRDEWAIIRYSYVPMHFWTVMGDDMHYNTRPTEKSPVRQQNAWFDRKKARFDRKMPGSTEKCPPQNASVDIAIIKHPPPPPLRNIFFQFFSHIFLRTNREMKIKLFWY